ncbi:Cell division protein FtsL [Pseudoclavibacter triregionum]|nr:Cell division protein FtsL [Pseudoclavibacter triregionum]
MTAARLAPAVRPARGIRPEVAPSPQRRLRLVEQLAPSRRTMRGLTLAGVIIGAVMLLQLVLTIAISQGAYEAEALEVQQVELDRQATSLEEQLSTVESPQNLTAQATALGMAPATQMQAIDPATGQTTTIGGSRLVTVNPALVGNEALNPTQPNAANPNVVPAAPIANGVSPDGSATAAVASVTDLASPTTR